VPHPDRQGLIFRGHLLDRTSMIPVSELCVPDSADAAGVTVILLEDRSRALRSTVIMRCMCANVPFCVAKEAAVLDVKLQAMRYFFGHTMLTSEHILFAAGMLLDDYARLSAYALPEGCAVYLLPSPQLADAACAIKAFAAAEGAAPERPGASRRLGRTC